MGGGRGTAKKNLWKTKNYDVVEIKIKGCFSIAYCQAKHEKNSGVSIGFGSCLLKVSQGVSLCGKDL